MTMHSLHLCLEAHDSLTLLICRSCVVLEGMVLFAKHFDSHVAFTQSVQLSHCVRMCHFEVTCMLCLVHELGTQYGPTSFFRFMLREVCLCGVMGIEGRL
jgi:hypothetical protein